MKMDLDKKQMINQLNTLVDYLEMIESKMKVNHYYESIRQDVNDLILSGITLASGLNTTNDLTKIEQTIYGIWALRVKQITDSIN